MWPLGLPLTLGAVWLLASVIIAIGRSRRLPTTDPRRPRAAWLAAAIVSATLAVAVGGTMTFTEPSPLYDPTGFYLLLAGVGLGALARALRLAAIGKSLRTDEERDQLVLLAWLLFGIGSCSSIPLLGS